jgi:hypothetical protein
MGEQHDHENEKEETCDRAEDEGGDGAGDVEAMLKRPNGATGPELMKATGWQSHSVRGFISRLGAKMKIRAGYDENGHRCYAVAG